MQGQSGSGKSTMVQALRALARAQCVHIAVASADFYFYEGGEYKFDPSKLSEAHQYSRDLAEKYMKEGHEWVVIDNTNTTMQEAKPYLELAVLHGYLVRVVRTDADLDDCVKYNAHSVPKHVVKKQADRIESLVNKPSRPRAPLPKVDQQFNLPHAIIVDIDGTLAIIGNRSPYDASQCDVLDSVNPAVWSVVLMTKTNHTPIRVIFVSGRSEVDKGATIRFLEKHLPSVYSYDLHMRKDGDTRPDDIVKREIYEEQIDGKYAVLFVLDDRDRVVDMWRSLGLHCFQVDYGNH